MIKKSIPGGQTGADQAASDAAIELGIPYGGWIPKGRLTERGLPRLKMDGVANDPVDGWPTSPSLSCHYLFTFSARNAV
jgi:hypothetical protein